MLVPLDLNCKNRNKGRTFVANCQSLAPINLFFKIIIIKETGDKYSPSGPSTKLN